MRTFLAILLLCSTAAAAEPQTFCKASVASVHDGDTVALLIDLGFNVRYGWVQVRLDGMDAWETTRARGQVEPFASFTPDQWSEEIRKGVKARDALKELVASGQVYVTPSEKRDPHGRTSARLYVWVGGDLVDAADWMKKRGHCR